MAVMTSMRTKMHVVLWAVLILFLLSMTVGGMVGGANILDQLMGKTNPAEAIGTINGEKIPPQFFNQMVNQQLEQYRTGGRTIDDQTLSSVRNQVWNNIIRDNLVAAAVEKAGITATNEEVLFHLKNNPPQFLRTMPDFQTNGQFDTQKYLDAISNPEGNEWAPIEQIMKTNIIPNYKLQKMLFSSVSVSDDEVRNEYVHQNVKFTIDAIHVTDRAVDEVLLEVSEDEIAKSYKARKDEFDQPELRDLRYVYWKKAPSAHDTTSVYNDGMELINRVKSGENFAELANLFTEDPSNTVAPDSSRGGDLGWFGHGQMVKPFDEAAFNARKGDIVGPILTQFGYHVIKIIDRRTNGGQPQVHAAHILLKIDMGAETRDKLRRNGTLFTYDAQDYSFDAALDTHSIKAIEMKDINRDAFYINEVGPLKDAVRFAFNSEVNTISPLLENDDYYAVFILNSVTPPGPTPLEEVSEQLKRELKSNKAKAEALVIANDLRSQLNKGASITDILAQDDRYESVTSDEKTLNSGFTSLGRSNYISGALLNAKTGDVLGPIQTARGYAIVFVKDVTEIDFEEYQISRDIVRNNLLSNKQNQVFEQWVQKLKDEANIEDFRKYHF